MIRKTSLMLFLYLLLLAMPSAVALELAFPDQQQPQMKQHATSVDDDGTIYLEGGSSIILSGIGWWPLFGGDGDNSNILPSVLLEKYLSQGPLSIYLEPKPKDRYGRMSAQILSANGTWLQKDLLEQGMAMFWPDSSQNNTLRLAETTARKASLGRWGWQRGVVKCHDWQGFWSEGMAIIAGRVKEVKTFGRTIYMNFGEEWWKDFTIEIDEKWARENVWKAETFIGQYIEIRGWLFWQAGPTIKLEHIEQITPLNEGGWEGASCITPQGGNG